MNDGGDFGPGLSGRLTYLLKRALFELHDLHDAHLAPFDVNVREFTVLLFLDGREPESQQEAAQGLGVDRTTMVGLLDALERKGLVTRHPDVRDRRRNVVELTAAGRKTLVRATRASDEAEARLLAGLDDAEAAQLRHLLDRIADGVPPPPRS